jgi:hypothetical protein
MSSVRGYSRHRHYRLRDDRVRRRGLVLPHQSRRSRSKDVADPSEGSRKFSSLHHRRSRNRDGMCIW